MNQRLQSLLAGVKARGGSFHPDFPALGRDVALYRAARDAEASGTQLRARTLLELVRLAPLAIDGGWRLIGDHLLYPRCELFWGVNAPQIPEPELAAGLARLEPELTLDELRRQLRELWSGGRSATAPGTIQPECKNGAAVWGENTSERVFMPGGWVENHSVRDYAKLLRLGYGGLKHEIAAELERYPIQATAYVERENFLRAADAVCDAGILLGDRYADLADSDTAERLRRIVRTGATTFADALQLLWLGHIVSCAEDSINANSLGRLDQILYPYYRADVEAGRIGACEAKEWLVEFAIRLYLTYDVQAITLGGSDRDGNCAVNEVSWLFLDATEEFGEIRDLSVRLHPDTPEPFLKRCVELVLRGGGIPFFFNDACFIPALAARGIALEDARDYAPIGCIELTVPGRANPHAVSGWFSLLKVLELTLHNGRNPANGRQLGPATGELAQFADFEALLAAFHTQVEFFAANMIHCCRHNERLQRNAGPLPALSLLTDDCIRRGRDITDGGAVYNYHSICLMGVPDTADALTALKHCCFDRHDIAPEELLAALQNDFAGREPLRRKLLALPKYGNGDDEVDRLAARTAREFIALMDRWSEPDNRLFVHLFTFQQNIPFGHAVGAMPDGRRAGEPLAYSLSAHQGRDLAGVTSFLHSLAKMPHREAAGASAAIIELHPSLFGEGDATELLTRLIRGAVALGVGQMQWNVVSVEELERARKEPERFGNLPVRVAGYSQMFKLVDPELQEHIIARYKHRTV